MFKAWEHIQTVKLHFHCAQLKLIWYNWESTCVKTHIFYGSFGTFHCGLLHMQMRICFSSLFLWQISILPVSLSASTCFEAHHMYVSSEVYFFNEFGLQWPFIHEYRIPKSFLHLRDLQLWLQMVNCSFDSVKKKKCLTKSQRFLFLYYYFKLVWFGLWSKFSVIMFLHMQAGCSSLLWMLCAIFWSIKKKRIEKRKWCWHAAVLIETGSSFVF